MSDSRVAVFYFRVFIIMTIIKRFASLVLLLPFLFLPMESFAEIEDISSAINKAGRQRMLSQRIVATYSQVGVEVQVEKSKRQLKDAIGLFDEQLAELKKFRDSGKINKQLQRVTELWTPLKALALEPVQRANMGELRVLAEDVLSASHRVVILLQDESGTAKSRLVNISGRQRMLSQRLANLYTIQSWGFTSSEYSGDYSVAMNEFKGAVIELSTSPLNTDEINRKLAKAKREFRMFQRSSHHKDGEFIPLMVKLSADKLLFVMNEVTYLYEKLDREN